MAVESPAVLSTWQWFRGLPSTMRVLLAAALVNNFGGGLAAPITLLFVSRGLGAPIDVATMTVAVSAAGSIVMHPVIGFLADRYSGISAALIGIALQIGGTAFLAVTHSVFLAFVGAFVAGMGSGTATAWSALLARMSYGQDRGRVFATNHLTLNVGMGAGLVASGLVAGTGSIDTYRELFAGRIVGLVVLAAVVLWLKDPAAQAQAASTAADAEAATPDSQPRLLSVKLVALCGCVFVLFGFGYAQLDAAFIGGIVATRSMPAFAPALVLLVNTVVVIVVNLRFTGSLVRVEPARLFLWVPPAWAAAWALAAAGFVWPSPVQALTLVTLGSAVFAVGEVIYAITQPSLTTSLSTSGGLARAFAVQNVVTSMAWVAGPALAAFALARLAAPAVMVLLAFGVSAALMPMFALRRRLAA